MRTRSSALIMAGLSVLPVWGSASPQTDYAGLRVAGHQRF